MFTFRSRQLAADALSVVASALSFGSIPRRSQPTNGPISIGVAGGLSLSLGCCQEVTPNVATNGFALHDVGLLTNGTGGAVEETPKNDEYPSVCGWRRSGSWIGAEGTPHNVSATLSISSIPAVLSGKVTFPAYSSSSPGAPTQT